MNIVRRTHRAILIVFVKLRNEGRLINEDSLKLWVQIVILIQNQNAGLSRDREFDHFSNFKSSTAFNVFLMQKKLSESQELLPFSRGKRLRVGKVLCDYGSPVLRHRLRIDAFSASLF